jgi:aminopeptidase N
MSVLLRSTAAALTLFAVCAVAFGADLALEVTLDPASRRFDAVAVIAARGDLTFTLHDALSVRRVTVDGRAIRFSRIPFQGNTEAWHVAVPKGAHVRIEYGGTLPALDASLDHRRVLGGLPPMVAPKGSFLSAGSGWYPHPGGLFTYTVALSVPADQRALVAGSLESEKQTGGRYSARFAFDAPADGIDLMAGPYTVREKIVPRADKPPLRLRTYFYGDLDALAADYLDDSARYIELYSNEIGAYPYDSFSIVASPLPTGFGMPTLTYLGAQVLQLPFIRATSLGHEVLHNWWGNGVHVDYATGNWSEGLTTFMADYQYKERESADAGRDMRLSWLRDFAAVPEGAHEPLSAFRSRTHGAQAAVGYGKAAMLFVMLRDAIGDAVFRRGIQRFWVKHRFTVASWTDLQTAFEETSGQQLGNFFRQWLERAGGPEVMISDARASERSGKWMLRLVIEQKAPAYTLDLPVEIVSAAKTEVRWIRTSNERSTETLELDAPPDTVRVDPELHVWRRLSRRELPPILREWVIARSPALIVASADAALRAAAESTARSFFEREPRRLPAVSKESADPTLLIGLNKEVDDALASAGLPPRPASVGNSGTTQVWTVDTRESGQRLAVISARDAASLIAIARPLPHYGAQSYLTFEGSKLLTRGVWPVDVPAVPVVKEP